MPDDAGFLGLVDPDAYVGFVNEQWTMPELVGHLRLQMRERRLLLWGTGREGMWRVLVQLGAAGPPGFREVAGPIVSTRGRLLLTHWGALTMAATYADTPLPEPHERDLLLTVPAAAYRCTIVQVHAPDADLREQPHILPAMDFVISLRRSDDEQSAWTDFPWTEGSLD